MDSQGHDAVTHEMKPLVPTGTASAELAARYPFMFKEGDPIGYVRPDCTDTHKATRKRRPHMADENMDQGDATATATEGKVRKPRKKKEKAPKEPKVKAPRKTWEPDEKLADLVEQLREGYARKGDRKACAYIVAQALELRALCKSVLDSGEGLPSSVDAVDGPDTLEDVAAAEDAVADDESE